MNPLANQQRANDQNDIIAQQDIGRNNFVVKGFSNLCVKVGRFFYDYCLEDGEALYDDSFTHALIVKYRQTHPRMTMAVLIGVESLVVTAMVSLIALNFFSAYSVFCVAAAAYFTTLAISMSLLHKYYVVEMPVFYANARLLGI